MFRMVRSGVHRRFTAFVAVLYAFCVLAPHAALALTHDSSAFHCLAEHELGLPHDHGSGAHAGSVHVHADGTTHVHHKDTAKQNAPTPDTGPAACCGLFAIAGLPLVARTLLVPMTAAETIGLVPGRDLGGRTLAPAHRPPIA